MNSLHLESALRILLAHRNTRKAHKPTRVAIRWTIRAIRHLRTQTNPLDSLRAPLEENP